MFDLLKGFLAGAIWMGCWCISAFFFRFFKKTRDRLFVCFAIAFFLLGIERFFIFWQPAEEPRLYAYLIRLLAFLVIVFGIISKNRGDRTRR